MNYSAKEIMQYVNEEDVKFIRLAFCDVYGKHRNISIMPGELERAFEEGIAIDASAIPGFGDEVHSDLFLRPCASTLALLPWRPEHGRVIRMFCDINTPSGEPFEGDTRNILRRACAEARESGLEFRFGAEMEFYLFKTDHNGYKTREPYDQAGYMDIAPDDKGENVRREICLTLEQMGIYPESSHHEEGPGQNEIDFRYSDPIIAADNAVTFRSVVQAIAQRNGLWADFSPKPLEDLPGNGFHINISLKNDGDGEKLKYAIAGILDRVADITGFLNPTEDSYRRFGHSKAPLYISWSCENRSQLIRVPATTGGLRRAELRSPDPGANPYLAFAAVIYAAAEGINGKAKLPDPTDLNLFTAGKEVCRKYRQLPLTLAQAAEIAGKSEFVRKHFCDLILNAYCNTKR